MSMKNPHNSVKIKNRPCLAALMTIIILSACPGKTFLERRSCIDVLQHLSGENRMNGKMIEQIETSYHLSELLYSIWTSLYTVNWGDFEHFWKFALNHEKLRCSILFFFWGGGQGSDFFCVCFIFMITA